MKQSNFQITKSHLDDIQTSGSVHGKKIGLLIKGHGDIDTEWH